ncbi:MAG: lecithin retinol acyltransferase family protein [Solirubrobacteraceae bacterium]
MPLYEPASRTGGHVVGFYSDCVTYKLAAAKFATGDHLRVWRPLGPVGYYHHGIYIDDARVVQFGGRIGDKAPGDSRRSTAIDIRERRNCEARAPRRSHLVGRTAL